MPLKREAGYMGTHIERCVSGIERFLTDMEYHRHREWLAMFLFVAIYQASTATYFSWFNVFAYTMGFVVFFTAVDVFADIFCLDKRK